MKSISQTPQRTKKQNHANIPCPIENCSKFTYGKLPDHLTKRHGLTGKERDLVNEKQRKRFFNGELCQMKFIKESAIMELWGDTYNDPDIRNKIHDSYALVKIRIIPISATTNRVMPLTEQDANVLTNYNARTVVKSPKSTTKRKSKTIEPEVETNLVEEEIKIQPESTSNNKRRKSCESASSEGEENNAYDNSSEVRSEASNIEMSSPSRELSSCESDSSNYSYEIVRQIEPDINDRLQDLLDTKLDDKYKYIINDMKKSMIMGRTLSSKKQRTYRTYKRYAKRLIVYLQKQNPCSADDIDDLLGKQKYVSMFMEAMNNYFKPKTVRNYIIACIKLLDSRLFLIETDPACKEKVAQLTLVYNLMHTYLVECMKLLPKKRRSTRNREATPELDMLSSYRQRELFRIES